MRPRRGVRVASLVLAAGAVWIGLQIPSGAADSEPPELPGAPAASSTLLLSPGQIRSLTTEAVERVAVGDPNVADITIVSSNEVLIQAKKAGSTNLLLWDKSGQHETLLSVVDPRPEALTRELTELVAQLGLPSVGIQRKDERVFLMGTVRTQAEFDSLEQLTAPFQGRVVNLASLQLPPAPPEPVPPMVKLAVQVVDISRTDLERLGVNWSQSMALTEPEVTDRTLQNALTRWGTSLTRSSVAAGLNALVQRNKARILAEPKLVTASGSEASSFIGVEVPVLESTTTSTGTSTVTATVEFKKTGVLLKITPTVLPTAQITTKLEAQVSDIDTASALSLPVGGSTVSVPGFKKRETTTQVTTESGETIVIAGLLQVEHTKSANQVPGLGSMPVIGRLFRSPEVKEVERELVVTVTPELVPDPRLVPLSAEATAEAVERTLESVQRRLEAASSPAAAPSVTEADRVAIANVQQPVADPSLQYALGVREEIAASLRSLLQGQAVPGTGTTRLRLHLRKDGGLADVAVAASSGSDWLDQAALRAARARAPYPAFPPSLPQGDLWLEVPVMFEP